MNYRRKEYNNDEFLSKDKENLIALARSKGFSLIKIDDSYKIVKLIKKNKEIYTTLSTNVNRTCVTKVFKDKISTYRFLENLNLNYPEGIYVNRNLSDSMSSIIDYLKNKYLSKSFVIKPNDSYQSKGVSIFEEFLSDELSEKAIKWSEEFSDTILIQDYVWGREFRFICFDGKIQFGIEKFDLSKKSVQCCKTIINQYQWIAEKIFSAIRPIIFCIDLIISDDKYSIIELNSSPGLSASLETYSDSQKESFYDFIFQQKIKF